MHSCREGMPSWANVIQFSISFLPFCWLFWWRCRLSAGTLSLSICSLSNTFRRDGIASPPNLMHFSISFRSILWIVLLAMLPVRRYVVMFGLVIEQSTPAGWHRVLTKSDTFFHFISFHFCPLFCWWCRLSEGTLSFSECSLSNLLLPGWHYVLDQSDVVFDYISCYFGNCCCSRYRLLDCTLSFSDCSLSSAFLRDSIIIISGTNLIQLLISFRSILWIVFLAMLSVSLYVAIFRFFCWAMYSCEMALHSELMWCSFSFSFHSN